MPKKNHLRTTNLLLQKFNSMCNLRWKFQSKQRWAMNGRPPTIKQWATSWVEGLDLGQQKDRIFMSIIQQQTIMYYFVSNPPTTNSKGPHTPSSVGIIITSHNKPAVVWLKKVWMHCHAAFSATVHDQKSEALHHPLQEICTDQGLSTQTRSLASPPGFYEGPHRWRMDNNWYTTGCFF